MHCCVTHVYWKVVTKANLQPCTWERRFAKLQEAGLRPDRVTYNTLLKCCMRNRLADQAMQTYREMGQLAIPVSLPPYVLPALSLRFPLIGALVAAFS